MSKMLDFIFVIMLLVGLYQFATALEFSQIADQNWERLSDASMDIAFPFVLLVMSNLKRLNHMARVFLLMFGAVLITLNATLFFQLNKHDYPIWALLMMSSSWVILAAFYYALRESKRREQEK